MLIETYLVEKSRDVVIANLYENENEYYVEYFINGTLVNSEKIKKTNFEYVDNYIMNKLKMVDM